nr:uncharacterized protein LOC114823950 isoform X2 [Malus domestica]
MRISKPTRIKSQNQGGLKLQGSCISLPLGFGRVRPAASQPYPSAGVHGGPEALGQLHSPHLAFERARPAASHSYPSAGVHRCRS